MSCACGNSPSLAKCCGPFIKGEALPPTAEALMRARYTAYTLKEVDYVLNTCDPDAPGEADRDATTTWAEKSQWLGLEVVSTEAGGPDDDEGQVEFIARYRLKGDEMAHHERARFRRVDGRWYYTDGQFVKPKTKKRDTPKIGRNDPCSCGSGEKYKKCCGAA